jgi:hypothetical protein
VVRASMDSAACSALGSRAVGSPPSGFVVIGRLASRGPWRAFESSADIGRAAQCMLIARTPFVPRAEIPPRLDDAAAKRMPMRLAGAAQTEAISAIFVSPAPHRTVFHRRRPCSNEHSRKGAGLTPHTSAGTSGRCATHAEDTRATLGTGHTRRRSRRHRAAATISTAESATLGGGAATTMMRARCAHPDPRWRG